MNITDIDVALESFTWTVEVDEVGDSFATNRLKDRTIQWIYSLDVVRGEQKLGGMFSLSTDEFSNACSLIFGEKDVYYPLVRSLKRLDIRATELTEEHIKHATDIILLWAKTQDLNKALNDYALLPTDAPGARPIWHLAALAILGNVEKLRSYSAGFRAGDRQGFAPYVTEEQINRALAIADGTIVHSAL